MESFAKSFKQYRLILLSLAFCIPPGLLSQKSKKLEIRLPISKVQLYRNQALVTRQGQLELQPGPNQITVQELPASLQNDSVRIRFVNGDSLKITEIRLESEFKNKFPSKAASQAEEMLKQAESDLRTLTDEYKALQSEEKFLLDLDIAKPHKNQNQVQPHRVHLEAWKKTLQFRQLSLAKNHARQLALQDKIDLAREKLAVALALADRYKSKISQESKELNFRVLGTQKQTYQVFLDYRVNGAAWYPVYTARVKSQAGSGGDTAQVRLHSYALVKNNSGEDWNNSRLAFSAADLNDPVDVVNLKSWKIKVHEREVTANRVQSENNASLRESDEVADAMVEKKKEAVKRRPSSIQQQERGGSPRRAKSLQLQKQKRLSGRVEQARDYYNANQSIVKDKRAAQRSQQSQKLLEAYQSNEIQRDRALKKGDYQSSLKHSEEILDNIGNLPQQYQKHFSEVEAEARKSRSLSLRMLENQKLIRKLVKPSIQKGGFDYRYQAPLKESVRSDGSFHKIYLGEKELEASLSYETAPLQSLHCFLTGDVLYKYQEPLLAGPVSVFHNADYLGESQFGHINHNNHFKLHLGSDDTIEISRQVHKYQSKTGLISTSYNNDLEVKIQIRNLKRRALKIHVFDRVPYSRDDRLNIKIVKLQPTPVDSRKKIGLYKFQLGIPANSRASIRMRYTISYPKGILPVARQHSGKAW